MPLSKNAQKYSSRRIGPRAPLPERQDRLLPPPTACCQRPIAPAATCRKGGPPAAILLLQARPRYGHSAKLAILHKTRRRGTAAAGGWKISSLAPGIRGNFDRKNSILNLLKKARSRSRAARAPPRLPRESSGSRRAGYVRRAIFVLFFKNLYGSWQANSIFTAGDFGRLTEEGQIRLYTPRAVYLGPLR
jgi:hypothetical protein